MKRPRLARLATDLLADEPLAARASSIEAEVRAVEAIAGAIRARARRQRRLRFAGGIAVAAAMLLAVSLSTRIGASNRAAPPPRAAASHAPAQALAAARVVEAGAGAAVVREHGSVPLVPSTALEAGDRLVATPAGVLALRLADASRIVVDADSDVTIASLSSVRRFQLSRGALRADVSKLGPGERFVVETSDAEVEVHGTSFRVALAPETEPPSDCTRARTRVTVFEGVVAVRWRGTEERLSAGTTWPAPCADPRSGGTAAIAPPEVPVTALRSSGRASAPFHAPPSETRSPPVSARPAQERSHALVEQNQFFAEATTARRGGNTAAAVAAYERLLARYPDGVLAESAAVERMRVLETIDRARARAAAADYLARYPKGFARTEAERLAGR